MAQPILYRPGVVAGIRQRISATVAEHVRMHQKIEAGALADALDQAVDGIRGERATASGGEDEPAVGELAPQLPQGPDFLASERVNARPFLARRTCNEADRPNST